MGAHWNYKRFAVYPHKGQHLVSGSMDAEHIGNASAQSKGGGGSHVRTEFKMVDTCEHGTFGGCSLMVFTIHSGKHHQIRASAAALGCPIIGDTAYGGPKYS